MHLVFFYTEVNRTIYNFCLIFHVMQESFPDNFNYNPLLILYTVPTRQHKSILPFQ